MKKFFIGCFLCMIFLIGNIPNQVCAASKTDVSVQFIRSIVPGNLPGKETTEESINNMSANPNKELPQTNEQMSLYLSTVGFCLISFSIFLYMLRKKKEVSK